jgi:hypothetical protein
MPRRINVVYENGTPGTNDTTAKVEALLHSILDLVYDEDPDHANDFILALISKLAIWSIFYQANYQMRQAIDKSLRTIEKRTSSSQFSTSFDQVLNDIIQRKQGP